MPPSRVLSTGLESKGLVHVLSVFFDLSFGHSIIMGLCSPLQDRRGRRSSAFNHCHNSIWGKFVFRILFVHLTQERETTFMDVYEGGMILCLLAILQQHLSWTFYLGRVLSCLTQSGIKRRVANMPCKCLRLPNESSSSLPWNRL